VSVYSAPWYTPAVQRILDLALDEDVGRGDATTAAVIDETQEAEAEIVSRERAVVCGLGVVEAVFTRFDWRTRVRMKVADGDPVQPDTVVASVRGPAAALLAGERTALNFLQHLSGIATVTQAFVAAAEGAKVRVTDTRKTTPGLRSLEKYAVRIGGGANHRSDLASGILIKDNHIALVGSVREAVRRARASAPHTLRVVCEVDNLAQLDEALEAGAEGVLLDNFQIREMADAVQRIRDRRPQTVIEASGGVTLDRIREISKTGVDVISTGSITHSARAINYSCEIRPVEGTAPARPSR
jgi:nicotinate-nucleotide pyrophosphorylase (carboxylating)